MRKAAKKLDRPQIFHLWQRPQAVLADPLVYDICRATVRSLALPSSSTVRPDPYNIETAMVIRAHGSTTLPCADLCQPPCCMSAFIYVH